MNEADFRRSYQERFRREGRGQLWRIPDAPPFPGADGRMRSAGQRPFDLFGLLADGRGVAVEVKYQKGGRTFNVGRHVLPHQLRELQEWARLGGLALLVVGWMPAGASRSVVVEVDASGLRGDEKIDLADATRRTA